MNDRKVIGLRIHWALILSFVIFYSFGIYGFLTVPSLGYVANTLVSIFLLSIFILFFKLSSNETFITTLSITTRDVYVFGSYFVIMSLLSVGNLFLPIDGDQLYHSQQAMLLSIKSVEALFTSHSITFIQNIPFVYCVWLVNIAILLCAIFLYFLTKKSRQPYILIGLSILFISLRYAMLAAGGNSSAFPTFRLFPIWLMGTLLSPSSFAFRMAAFVGLSIIMWTVYTLSSKRLSSTHSYLLGIFSGTIPVLFHIGGLVEMSLWTCLCLVLTLFFIDIWSEGKSVNYVQIVTLVVILSCMRVSCFIALIPIFGMMLYDYYHKKVTIADIRYALAPCLVLLPILFMSMYIGTPSTYHGVISLDPYVPENTNLIGRLGVAIHSGAFYTNVYNSIRIPLIFLLGIVPFIIFRNYKKGVLVTLLFTLYFVIFYSIEPGLWGHGRYIAEFIVPFIIYSIYLLSTLCKRNSIFLIVLLISGSIYNVYSYIHIPEMNTYSIGQDVYSKAINKRGEYFALSEFPYSFDQALVEAKKDGYAGKLYYSPGNGYGYFTEILSGYTISEIHLEKLIISKIGVGIDEKTADVIIANKDVKLVLINGSPQNKGTLNEKLAYNLQNKGWTPWKQFSNEKYKTVLYGFIRPD